MPKDQIFMGLAIVCACALGLWHRDWLLKHSRYGRRLTQWFGPRHGRLVLLVLLTGGVLFGVLLAANLVRPMQW